MLLNDLQFSQILDLIAMDIKHNGPVAKAFEKRYSLKKNLEDFEMLKWYGYLHVNGTVHLKTYGKDYLDIVEARSSDFVSICIEPFEAADKAEALIILNKKLNRPEA